MLLMCEKVQHSECCLESPSTAVAREWLATVPNVCDSNSLARCKCHVAVLWSSH